MTSVVKEGIVNININQSILNMSVYYIVLFIAYCNSYKRVLLLMDSLLQACVNLHLMHAQFNNRFRMNG